MTIQPTAGLWALLYELGDRSKKQVLRVAQDDKINNQDGKANVLADGGVRTEAKSRSFALLRMTILRKQVLRPLLRSG
jgi:hypothetical protein